jgi:hypothetical protein
MLSKDVVLAWTTIEHVLYEENGHYADFKKKQN